MPRHHLNVHRRVTISHEPFMRTSSGYERTMELVGMFCLEKEKKSHSHDLQTEHAFCLRVHRSPASIALSVGGPTTYLWWHCTRIRSWLICEDTRSSAERSHNTSANMTHGTSPQISYLLSSEPWLFKPITCARQCLPSSGTSLFLVQATTLTHVRPASAGRDIRDAR